MASRKKFHRLNIELERDTPEERAAYEAAVTSAHQSQQRFAERNKDGPIPQLDDDGFFRDFIDNELTPDTLHMLIKRDRKLGLLAHVPRCLPYVVDGWEIHHLKQQRVFRMEEPKKALVPLRSLPSPLRTALQDDRNRLLRALSELTKYMQKKLGGETDAMGNVVTPLQMELLALESEVYLHASVGLLPVQNRFARPMSIALKKPLHKSDSVSILFFVANKERKAMFRKLMANMPWAKNVKLLQMQKYRDVFQARESKDTLFNSYDLFFADEQVELELYTLGTEFDSLHYRKAPIVINDDSRVCDIIDGFVSGTKIFISRGLQPISVHVGFAQWKPEDIKNNVISVVQQLGHYVEGGYDNILRLYVSGENTPSLPFYYNEKAYMQRFKECKYFTKEQEWVKANEEKRTVNSDDDEDDDDDDVNYLYAKYGAKDDSSSDDADDNDASETTPQKGKKKNSNKAGSGQLAKMGKGRKSGAAANSPSTGLQKRKKRPRQSDASTMPSNRQKQRRKSKQ